jgi:hypothetical protein
LVNPALADLDVLLGEWDMVISNASFLAAPDETVTGWAEVVPVETGNLVAMRQMVDPAGPPMASWVIGRDSARPGYVVLYTDSRGVSRIYEMTLEGDSWKLWRNDPDFSQRFEATVNGDRSSIAGRWEKCHAAAAWEHDFDVTYSRRA